MPDYVSISNVFIDDILLWDGQIFLGVLGGAGVHAMAGARVWSDSLGLVASIGHDFEDDFMTKLGDLGLDLSMLREAQEKTTRAWQIFQPDEERVEVFRDKNNLVHQLSLETVELTEAYRQAKGWHVHFSGSLSSLLISLEKLRKANPEMVIVMEPSMRQTGWDRDAFQQVFPLVDVFSPNEIEGEQLTGETEPAAMVAAFLSWGAPRVALRQGEKGSLLAGQDQPMCAVPAVKDTIVDVTGAGNAYMGGMLVGLCEGLSFTEAALWGAVSASFAIEQFGICMFDDGMIPARDRRLAEAKKKLDGAAE